MEPKMFIRFEELLRPVHTALFIIDMQKDFCLEGFGVHRAGRDLRPTQHIIPNVSQLLSAARQAGVLIFHVGFLTLPDHMSDSGPWLVQRRRSTYASDSLTIAGSEGAEFIEELTPQSGEFIIHKHRYSAFKGTALDMLLRSHEIRSIVISGISTNVCVESTLREAFELGYYVCVPRDGAASWDMNLHDATLENVSHRFGLVKTCGEIISSWKNYSIVNDQLP